MAAKPSIFVLNTGGLITAKKMGRTWHPGLYTTEEFLKGMPKLGAIADIDAGDLFRIDSAQIQPDNWSTLANFLHSKIRKYDGVVILHGTDTMAYTAAALSFMLQNTGKPIVFTGAQYAPDQVGSDAQRNTSDAIKVAANSELGETAIVFNRKIFRATRCRKVSDTEYEAFAAAEQGLLGMVEHEIRLRPHAKRRKASAPKVLSAVEPNVLLVKTHPGFDAATVECLANGGARGAVVETYWSAMAPQRTHVLAALHHLTETMPVALTRDTLRGGCEHDGESAQAKKLSKNLIPCRDMLTETALTKLMWTLGQNRDLRQVRKTMETNVAGEMAHAKKK